MILIIAYGNDLREDDGAGLVLAEHLASTWRLRGTPVHLVAVHQLVPELAADILENDVTAVVFADARMSTSPGDGDVSVAPLEPTVEQSPSLGHHVQPDVLLSYARLLYAADSLPPAWLVTAPGVAFGFGERLSEVAQAAIRRAFEDQSSPLGRLITELAAS